MGGAFGSSSWIARAGGLKSLSEYKTSDAVCGSIGSSKKRRWHCIFVPVTNHSSPRKSGRGGATVAEHSQDGAQVRPSGSVPASRRDRNFIGTHQRIVVQFGAQLAGQALHDPPISLGKFTAQGIAVNQGR